MNEIITFKTPAFADDQLAGGRYIYPFPLLSFMFGGRGTVTIKNGIMTYKESFFSSPQPESFDLSKISNILVVRTKHPISYKDFKLFSLETPRASFYLELFLIFKNGEKHILMPSFVDIDRFGCRRQWEKFLDKLKMFTCLPLEKIEITKNNKLYHKLS